MFHYETSRRILESFCHLGAEIRLSPVRDSVLVGTIALAATVSSLSERGPSSISLLMTVHGQCLQRAGRQRSSIGRRDAQDSSGPMRNEPSRQLCCLLWRQLETLELVVPVDDDLQIYLWECDRGAVEGVYRRAPLGRHY